MEQQRTPLSDAARHIVDEALQAAAHETTAGQPAQAEALYRAVLDLAPGHAEAHFGLGMLARQAGDLATAIPHLTEALQGATGEQRYWLAYIEALIAARQFATASDLIALGRSHGLAGPEVDAFEQQLATVGAPDPATIDAATALFGSGRLDEAGYAAQFLTEQFPQHPFGYKLLGGIHHLQGNLLPALESMQVAVQYAPDDAEALSNLGLLLRGAGRLTEAQAVLERAVALRADDAHIHNHMALTLLDAGRLSEAHASASTALALDPAHAQAGNTLAMILQHQGRALEAVEAYRAVLARDPHNTDAHSNMLFCMSQVSSIGPDALFAAHRTFGRQLEAKVGLPRSDWRNTPDPARPLRIGFVSGDLRNHAVVSFIEPLLEHLAHRPGLVLHTYYTHVLRDTVTKRLRGHMAIWHDVAGTTDAALDALIRADGIDILIDLAGHTAYNRLPVFARKPAPVQASWIGYPGTTGLAAMDYYLTDHAILPPGQYDHLFTEKLVHLPITAPFQPAADAPDLIPPPALTNGFVTFGSFNRLSKISREVVAVWSSLLRAEPDARLLVAGLPEQGREQLWPWFEEEGIASERLRFHGRTGMYDYLALHNEVDICLDTFPYSGGTTTLHAMSMGVPTLTLKGDTAAGRQTVSILEHNGLLGFIASDAEEFVVKGKAACRNLARVTELRTILRGRFSPNSSDAMIQVAGSFEHALRMMWQRWCAGLPAASFAVPILPAPQAEIEAEVAAEAATPAPPAPLETRIFVTQPAMPPLADFIPYLEQIWESKFLTNGGQFHQQLEEALCAYLGVEHISLFANGTVALMTALQALGIEGEVITTPYSFVATSHALLWNGLQPVFVDINPVTFNLDPARIEEAITPRTTAIMPVHCYGNPCDVEAIEHIASKHGLKVIYDAAHAFGVRQNGASILRHGDLSVLSFHATKVFNTFEGGAIICHDAETKRYIDLLKNFGIEDEQTVVAAGINGKMNEVSAAFGLLQLRSVDASLEKRRQVAATYRELLGGINGIDPLADLGHEANYGYFPILVRDGYPLSRDALHQKLRDAGIYVRRYFYPLITAFPMYAQFDSAAPDKLPVAHQVAKQVLCLPIYPMLEPEQLERICHLIRVGQSYSQD
jgi:dTDP-4-amino-4,6-dideoxygalactose transaminase/predicted O-linked N-acetylglucosamine transferase (SPINDLY family)